MIAHAVASDTPDMWCAEERCEYCDGAGSFGPTPCVVCDGAGVEARRRCWHCMAFEDEARHGHLPCLIAYLVGTGDLFRAWVREVAARNHPAAGATGHVRGAMQPAAGH